MRRRTTVLVLCAGALGVCATATAGVPGQLGLRHSYASGLDSRFGVDGIAAQPAGSAATGVRFVDVAVGRDGRSYAVGHANVDPAGGREQAMALARLAPDGSLDPDFGTGGVAVVNVAPGRGGAEVARGVAVQRDGAIVLAGQAESSTAGADPRDLNIYAARFTPMGVLDPSFAGDGVLELDLSPGAVNPATGSYRTDQAYGLAMGPDDKAVIVAVRGPDTTARPGRVDRDFAITRLTRGGELDPKWSNDGIAIVNTRGVGSPGGPIEDLNESPRQGLVQPDGKVVIGSYSEGSDGRAEGRVLRFKRNGELDPRFGDGGIATLPDFFPDGNEAEVAEFYAVDQHRGGYVVGGYGASTTTGKVDLIAARFTHNGKLDRSFGTDGRVIVDVAGNDDRARDLVALPDGRILLAGSTVPTPGNLQGFLVQLKPDGSFNDGFGEAGKLQIDLGTPIDSFFGVTLTRNNQAALAVGHIGAANPGSGRVDPGDEGRAVRVVRLRP